MNWTYSLSELDKTAKEVIAKASHKVLLFRGDMGVGKTTLIKEICLQLGVTDVISSPTFSLVNEYITKQNETIYHFDFYRIQQEEEALDIGIDEYLYSKNWCFIEWAEKIENLLPLEVVNIQISRINEHKRMIEII